MKPSKNQVWLLKEYGLRIPPKQPPATRLISYIKKGNGTGPVDETETERIEQIKGFEIKWYGKQVENGDSVGILQYILPKYANEVMDRATNEIHEDFPRDPDELHPFYALVKWTGGKLRGKTSRVTMGTIALVTGQST